jgi:Family of unknown function (DUF5677)
VTDQDPEGRVSDALERWIEELAKDPAVVAAAEQPDFEQLVEQATQAALTHRGEALLEDLLRRAPEMLGERRTYRMGFEERLREIWGEALDLFGIFHMVCLERGEDFNARNRSAAAAAHDYRFDVLARLHARSCLVASEVLTLLRSGFASGAHGRWRTLHELAVVAYFIHERDDEVARRYLLHDAIQAYKAGLAYDEHHQALGYEPRSSSEREALKRRRDALVAEFGTPFADDFGWAAEAIGRPAHFRAIEAAVNLGHLRPYYRMASNPVHPNVRGSLFDLGVVEGREILLAGPSNAGLADPGHATCISLMQTTVCLLNHEVEVEGVAAMLVLQQLLSRVGDAFLAAHERLDELIAEARRDG